MQTTRAPFPIVAANAQRPNKVNTHAPTRLFPYKPFSSALQPPPPSSPDLQRSHFKSHSLSRRASPKNPPRVYVYRRNVRTHIYINFGSRGGFAPVTSPRVLMPVIYGGRSANMIRAPHRICKGVPRAVLRERNSTPLNYYHPSSTPPVISLFCALCVSVWEKTGSEIVCRLILIQFSVQMSATGRAKAAVLFQPDDLWCSLLCLSWICGLHRRRLAFANRQTEQQLNSSNRRLSLTSCLVPKTNREELVCNR